MAVANLSQIIQSYIMQRNRINLELTNYSTQKTLSTAQTSDLAAWKNARESAIRTEYKNIFSTQYKDVSNYNYSDYSEIPEYQDEIDYVESFYNAKTEDLAAWELQLDNQITTMNTELSEINSYIDSFKQMLSSNIKVDYNYGLNS